MIANWRGSGGFGKLKTMARRPYKTSSRRIRTSWTACPGFVSQDPSSHVGPAWQAAADLQEGNLTGASVNTALAIADATPIGPLVKGAKVAKLGIGVVKKGSVTAGAAAKMIKKAGLSGPGREIHHSIPLDGIGRSVQDWRNHYLFLKVLPKDVHRRLHGRWAGKPRYDPIRRIWYGSTDWQKAFPTSAASMTADSIENANRNPSAKSK
jgi:hypothetical protein